MSSRPDPLLAASRMSSSRDPGLAAWAESGVLPLTGRHDGPPQLPPGRAALQARRHGRPFGVDGAQLLGERAAIAGLARHGRWSPGRTCRPVRAADGWWVISLIRQDDLDMIPALVERPVAGDPWRLLSRWSAGRATGEIVARARLLGMAAAIVGERDARARPGVLVGERTAGQARATAGPPLVIDLSALWAGPLCAHLLGLAGARVVKVESVRRPDGARSGPAAFYDLLHYGHESVALDLGDPVGAHILQRLLRRADVVIESSRPRALQQLGIDADAILAERTVTWVSITGYGRELGQRAGFGDDTALAAGLTVTDPRYAGPMPCGDAIADPLTGLAAAHSVLGDLRSGGSRMIDVSMRDVVADSLRSAEPEALCAKSPAGWLIRGLRVQPPVARQARGPAPRLGEHTRTVLAEFGCT